MICLRSGQLLTTSEVFKRAADMQFSVSRHCVLLCVLFLNVFLDLVVLEICECVIEMALLGTEHIAGLIRILFRCSCQPLLQPNKDLVVRDHNGSFSKSQDNDKAFCPIDFKFID